MTDAPIWTILVPTLGQRAELFGRLMDVLLPQLEPYEGRVRVLAWWNNGDPPLAHIRQGLVEAVDSAYLSFADDDDLVPPYFVEEGMKALESRPDYVGWQTRYNANGVDHGLVEQSLRHGGWAEDKKTGTLLRDITHINIIRTDVAKRADFRRGSRPGHAEDRPWTAQIRKTGLLQTEVYIDREMYFYLWRSDTTAWQKPQKISKHPSVRPHIDSPYFAWHPASGGICAPAMTGHEVVWAGNPPGGIVKDKDLLIIIPTRGRPENMARVIKAWRDTGAFEVASVLFALDNDDPELERYLEIPASHLEHSLNGGVMVTQADRLPMALRTNAEAAQAAAHFYALGSAGDDHLPETHGWAQRYLRELRELRSGIVYGDDGYQGAKLCTEWVMTSDIVKALGGRLIPAPVNHLYADNSVMELGKVSGSIRHIPEVKITHMHPAAGRAQRDEGYERVNAQERYREDGNTFNQWKRTRLAQDGALVRGLGGLRVTRVTRTGAVRQATRHRIEMGLGKKGTIRSRPSVTLNPSSRKKPAMSIPRRIREVRGLTSDDALMALADMAVQVPSDQAIVELGVYLGKSLLTLAWGSSQGGGAHVWGIDPWDLCDEAFEHPSDPMYRKWPMFNSAGARNWASYHVKGLGYANRITLIHGFSAEAGHVWSGPPVGLLFVDGDHRYEAVRRDVVAWAAHLAPGATIVFDDYESSHPETIRSIEDLVAAGVLEPVQVFHGRLAVTKLAPDWSAKLHALEEGWVRTPEEIVNQQVHDQIRHLPDPVATQPDPVQEFGTIEVQLGPVQDPQLADLLVAQARFDDGAEQRAELAAHAAEVGQRLLVQAGELDGVAPGTPIEELTLPFAKALAKKRGIVLGSRKDKKELILQALRDGR